MTRAYAPAVARLANRGVLWRDEVTCKQAGDVVHVFGRLTAAARARLTEAGYTVGDAARRTTADWVVSRP